MGFIKTILPPISPLGLDMSKMDGPKVIEGSIQSTLCGLIDMLGLISVKAHEVFQGIMDETSATVQRVHNLNTRVASLQATLPVIDRYFENNDFETLSSNTRSFYKSKHDESNRMLTPQSRPPAVRESYEQCRRPPNLEKLDSLNENGDSCLKLYSDPGFFEAEWILEMEKQRQAAKAKKKERKQKRAVEKKTTAAVSTTKVEVKTITRVRYDPHTGQRIDIPERGSSTNLLPSPTSLSSPERGASQSNLLLSPSPAPTPAPHPIERGQSVPTFVTATVSPRAQPTGSLTHAQARSVSAQTTPRGPTSQPPSMSPRATPQTPSNAPPTLARPVATNHAAPPPAPVPAAYSAPPPVQYAPPPAHTAPPPVARPAPAAAAPPPPPAAPPPPPAAPPPPPPNAPPPPPSAAGGPSLAAALAAKGSALRPADEVAKAKPVDAQSELLNQIKKGMNLKAVTAAAEVESKPAAPDNSVAAILARRIAIADSDDESGNESDEWSD